MPRGRAVSGARPFAASFKALSCRWRILPPRWWRCSGIEEAWKHYLDWLYTTWLSHDDKPTDADTQIFRFLKRAGFVEPHQS
jgi:hypothetical protein